MQVIMACGKGGVGKSTVAAGLALHLANEGKKTGLVSYDGPSVKRLMGIKEKVPANTALQMGPSFFLSVIENTGYLGIRDSQEAGKPLKEYLAQFPADLGILPFADMARAFFGVPTDTYTLQKLIRLVMLLNEHEKQGFVNAVVDVEPTHGFESLLSNMNETMQSLRNLKSQGLVQLIAIGATWPDIAGYIRSSYIQSIDDYVGKVERAMHLIKHASFFIVCTPEKEPVVQTQEVLKIIEKFGGSVHGYVMNNTRGEAHEARKIALLPSRAAVVKIARRPELHEEGSDDLLTLRIIGREVSPLIFNGR